MIAAITKKKIESKDISIISDYDIITEKKKGGIEYDSRKYRFNNNLSQLRSIVLNSCV